MHRESSLNRRPTRQDLEMANTLPLEGPTIPAGSTRILDLGCGKGQCLLPPAGRPPAPDVKSRFLCGLDIDMDPLRVGKAEATCIHFVQGSAKQLPFRGGSFDCVISGVAMPYIDIPRALAEAWRVLQPDGHLRLSLHSLRYFWAEYLGYLRGHRWKSIVYKLYVLANGITFHFTGRLFHFPLKRSRIESFQTSRAMRLALERAGFVKLKMLRGGERFLLIAEKGPTA